jgi:hypothetical protein
MPQTSSTATVATAIVSHVRPDRKPPRVIATWGERFVVAHDRRVFLVTPGQACTCGPAVCEHRQAVAAILEEGRAVYLASVGQELAARECPRCHQRRLLQLAGALAILTVCEACGFGHVVYAEVPHHSGNGRHRHAVTASRGRRSRR